MEEGKKDEKLKKIRAKVIKWATAKEQQLKFCGQMLFLEKFIENYLEIFGKNEKKELKMKVKRNKQQITDKSRENLMLSRRF